MILRGASLAEQECHVNLRDRPDPAGMHCPANSYDSERISGQSHPIPDIPASAI